LNETQTDFIKKVFNKTKSPVNNITKDRVEAIQAQILKNNTDFKKLNKPKSANP